MEKKVMENLSENADFAVESDVFYGVRFMGEWEIFEILAEAKDFTARRDLHEIVKFHQVLDEEPEILKTITL